MQKRFQSVLEKIGRGPTRVIARVPFDPMEAWPGEFAAGRLLRVKGTMRAAGKKAMNAEGAAFRYAMLAKLHGEFLLVVTQKMQNAARVAVGVLTEFALEPDPKPETTEMPEELRKLLRQDRSFMKWYGQLAESLRRYVAGTIMDAKAAETRERRAEQWAEQLMLMMEGEHEPPPVLKAAFREHPRAEAGWNRLTLNQRRVNLMTIFGARSPEARAKRVEFSIEQALRAAERGRARRRIDDEE